MTVFLIGVNREFRNLSIIFFFQDKRDTFLRRNKADKSKLNNRILDVKPFVAPDKAAKKIAAPGTAGAAVAAAAAAANNSRYVDLNECANLNCGLDN